jgi:hypothetical protein
MEDSFVWHNAQDLTIEGRVWDDAPGPFCRLPEQVKPQVSEFLWSMGTRPAGVTVRFRTNSPIIRARWKVGSGYHVNARETACLIGGIDCYGRNSGGQWYWVGCAQPEATGTSFEAAINSSVLDGNMRGYRVYLPIGEMVEELAIGILDNTVLEKVPADLRKPVVMYGTSIVHGYCVSRPGMTHTAIVQRRMDIPFVNLGFGGAGRMDEPIANLLSEIDAAMYVVDCLPNMDPDMVQKNMPRLVEIIRAKRPLAPILFVGSRKLQDAAFIPSRQKEFDSINAMQRAAYQKLKAAGVANLHLFEDPDFFGNDFEGTVDGSHPTDLGALRMADKLEPVIRNVLEKTNAKE